MQPHAATPALDYRLAVHLEQLVEQLLSKQPCQLRIILPLSLSTLGLQWVAIRTLQRRMQQVLSNQEGSRLKTAQRT